jgi:hypothetical protein
MSKMAEIDMEIRDLLDTTRWSIDEIANYCQCPVAWVEAIVEERWVARLNRKMDEVMSPFQTCNS